MKKTNTSRIMTVEKIEDSINEMIKYNEAELLMEFITRYPHFVKRYVELLLKKLELINTAIADIRSNE